MLVLLALLCLELMSQDRIASKLASLLRSTSHGFRLPLDHEELLALRSLLFALLVEHLHLAAWLAAELLLEEVGVATLLKV